VRLLSTVVIIVCASFATSTAQAQWTGKAELGVQVSSGNAESTSANTKLDLAHESEKWKQTIYAGALYGANGSFTTAERYEARYQADYKINDRLSWFGALRGEQDSFSGFVYQATVSTGAAYKFIDSPTTKFAGSLGAGYRTLKEELLTKSAAGEVIDRTELESHSEPIITLGSTFEHNFTETTKLTNKLLAESGSDNTAVQDDISLQVSMTDTLALAVGFGVRYNTDPPPLSETTDLLTTINLVYNIK